MNKNVTVYTFADKRPDFIKPQLECIKTFLGNNVSYEVINNGSTPALEYEIEKTCQSLGIYCRLTKKDHSNPNQACAFPLNHMKEHLLGDALNQNVIPIILDSDMFPIAPFNVHKFMHGYNIAGTKQRRGHVKYIWNGIMMFQNLSKEQIRDIDFNYGMVEGQATDVGGHLHYFFKNHPEVKLQDIYHTSHIHPSNNNMDAIPPVLQKEYDPEFRMEIYAQAFLHYGRGSNWDNMPADYHHKKTEFLHSAINEAVELYDLPEVYGDCPECHFNHKNYIFNTDSWQ